MNIENFGKGCVLQPTDERDIIYEEVMKTPLPFDWKKGFNIEKRLGIKLKVEHQNGSSSCVSQAFSKYLEVLEFIDSGNQTDLSAKDMYSRIFLPDGGAYLRDGAKLAVKRGVTRELTNPSYMNGTPPTEAFMRELIEGNEGEAIKFSSKSYASVTSRGGIDHIAQTIRDNNGVVTGVSGDNQGWGETVVKPPKYREWGHAIYLGRAEIINGKKYIGLLNSWGEGVGDKGWQWLGEDYLDYMFDLWTLVDFINIINKTMKLIREKDRPETYAVVNGHNYYIGGPLTFEDFAKDNHVKWEEVKEVNEPIRCDGIIARGA